MTDYVPAATVSITPPPAGNGATFDAVIDAAVAGAERLRGTLEAGDARASALEGAVARLADTLTRINAAVASACDPLPTQLNALTGSVTATRGELARAEGICLADVGGNSWRARQRLALMLIGGYGPCAGQQIAQRPPELDAHARLFAEKYDGLVGLIKKEIAHFDECFRDLDVALNNLMKAVDGARVVGQSVKTIDEVSMALPRAIDPVHQQLLETTAKAAGLASQIGGAPAGIASTLDSVSSRISSLFGVDGLIGHVRSKEEQFLSILDRVDSLLRKARDLVHDDVVGPVNKLDEVIRSIQPLIELMRLLQSLGLI